VAELISHEGVCCMELFRYLVDFWRKVMRGNLQWYHSVHVMISTSSLQHCCSHLTFVFSVQHFVVVTLMFIHNIALLMH
jgi:hypothetical protein